jgi:septum formation protein
MSDQSHKRKIFLASSSPYRKMLLQRLQVEFEVAVPDVDETPLENESAEDLARRLAEQKARVTAQRHPEAVIIGSDQVAVFRGKIVGKPGSRERALNQLRGFSGNSVDFLTAVSVCCSATGFSKTALVSSGARFRPLTDDEIQRYLDLDKPLDCAGAFKSEAAGSALLEYLRSDDPTAIIGLPLITVAALLRENGFRVP